MNDLSISLTRTVGRAPKAINAEIVRELDEADLALLGLEKGIKAPTLKRLRDSHHNIARLMAQGLSNTDIAAITGYSQSRLSILKADPSFQELMAFYKENTEAIKDSAFAGVQEKLALLNHDAIEEIHERLTDSPEAISTDQLMDIVKMTADRTGHGPQSKSTQVNVNIDIAARVAKGRERVQIGAGLHQTLHPVESASPPALMKVVEGAVVDARLAPSLPDPGGGKP